VVSGDAVEELSVLSWQKQEHESIMGVWRPCLPRVQGHSPWSDGKGQNTLNLEYI